MPDIITNRQLVASWFARHALLQVSMCGLACGWNALVLDLRQRDLLSNKELACLTFEELQLTDKQKEHLRKLQTQEKKAKDAGKVPEVALGLTTVLPARCVCLWAPSSPAAGICLHEGGPGTTGAVHT